MSSERNKTFTYFMQQIRYQTELPSSECIDEQVEIQKTSTNQSKYNMENHSSTQLNNALSLMNIRLLTKPFFASYLHSYVPKHTKHSHTSINI